jgi:hypothetical protein
MKNLSPMTKHLLEALEIDISTLKNAEYNSITGKLTICYKDGITASFKVSKGN